MNNITYRLAGWSAYGLTGKCVIHWLTERLTANLTNWIRKGALGFSVLAPKNFGFSVLVHCVNCGLWVFPLQAFFFFLQKISGILDLVFDMMQLLVCQLCAHYFHDITPHITNELVWLQIWWFCLRFLVLINMYHVCFGFGQPFLCREGTGTVGSYPSLPFLLSPLGLLCSLAIWLINWIECNVKC